MLATETSQRVTKEIAATDNTYVADIFSAINDVDMALHEMDGVFATDTNGETTLLSLLKDMNGMLQNDKVVLKNIIDNFYDVILDYPRLRYSVGLYNGILRFMKWDQNTSTSALWNTIQASCVDVTNVSTLPDICFSHTNIAESLGEISNDENFFDIVQQELSYIEDFYSKWISDLFGDSVDPFAFEIHSKCVQDMADFNEHSLSNLTQLLNIYHKLSYSQHVPVDQAIQDISTLLAIVNETCNHMTEMIINFYFASGRSILPSDGEDVPVCLWPITLAFSDSEHQKFNTYNTNFQVATSTANLIQQILRDTRGMLLLLLPYPEQMNETLGIPMMRFLEQNITKLTLSHIFSTRITTFIYNYRDMGTNFEELLKYLMFEIKTLGIRLRVSFQALFSMNIPIVKMEDLAQFDLIRRMIMDNEGNLLKPVNTIMDMANELDTVLVKAFDEDYTTVDKVFNALIPAMETLFSAVNTFNNHLYAYDSNSKIDKQFYM